MAFGRFEKKILAAILAVAIMPLVGALFLGKRALREAYGVGVNERVREQLEQGLTVYREHFAALRADAERTAEACARDHDLIEAIEQRPLVRADLPDLHAVLAALLARYDNVTALQVIGAGGVAIATEKRAGVDEGSLRLLTLERTVSHEPPVTLNVTVGTSAKHFGDYLRAGELSEVFRALERGSDYVTATYLAVYIGLLFGVIVTALGIGIMLSRRVTRRVAQLADATAQVGAGDLNVNVPTDDRDEVGDLTRAFNTMVRDMRDSRDRIEYLSRISAWQEFARRLAHEIKNPLTPIQLAVQEAHRSYRGDDPRFQRMLEDTRSIVEEEIATLRRLVGEFSEFARLPQVRLESADLGVFVQDAMESAARVVEHEDDEPHVVLETEVADAPLPVRIDAMLLKRCLDNLVRNAAHAVRSARPTGTGHIHIVARAEGDQALLEVCDDGPGVPLESRERIFDPYYTTKAEGTGLGLAIVKKTVLEHGGEITCLEASQGGACFRITLPMTRTTRPSLVTRS
jgi:signal transduction histidine kinase